MRTDRPVFLYSMVPRGRTTFRNFFETIDLRKIIEEPGTIRPSGWDLETRDRARIVNGQYLEVASAERKRLQVYEDGSVLARVPGDDDFMGWGQNTKNFDAAPRLNTLALIEFTLNFCKLCARLVPLLQPPPSQIDVKVEIRNAFFGNSRLFLIPYPVSNAAFTLTEYRRYPSESSMVRKVTIPPSDLGNRPGAIAYRLLKQIFIWFNSEEEIPYTAGPENGKYVDENLIIDSRSG
jgi:hypothetical protein